MTTHIFTDSINETGPAISALKPGGDIETIAVASQWKLIWAKFVRQKVAVVAGVIILLFYLVGVFAEFLAPALPETSRPQYTYAPPQAIRLFVPTPDGGSQFLPHVKGYTVTVDQASLRRTFVPDDSVVVPIGFFVPGPAYKLWGLIPMTTHLIGPLKATDPMYLLGTDRLGRDLLSRLIYGTRISMSIGLIGVCISLCLGVVLGSLPASTAAGSIPSSSASSKSSARCRPSRSGWGWPRRCRSPGRRYRSISSSP